MTGVLANLLHRRPRTLRLAAALALLAQVVAVAVAPVADVYAREGPPTHVEAAGTHQHHEHNPATCPACIAIALNATSVPGTPVAAPVPAAHRLVPVSVASAPITAPRRVEPKAPRAPPRLRRTAR